MFFRKRNWLQSIMLISVTPGTLLILLFFLLPLLLMVRMSFTDDYPNPTTYQTFENYSRALTGGFHQKGFITTLKMSLAVTLSCVLVGYPVAYFLVHSRSRLWKGVVFFAIISPLLISLVVRSLGWLILLGRQGVINQTLLWLGIIDEPIQFMYTFGAVIVGLVHVLLPFMVLSISSVLGQIPPSMNESAAVLGAPPLRRFFSITLPLSMPGVMAGSFLVFALSMGSYVTPQMLGGGRVGVVTLDIVDRMLVVFNWPLGSALAVLLLLLTLVTTLLLGIAQRRLTGIDGAG